MTDLTEFLLARIAEDQADARRRGADAMAGHLWTHLPERDYYAIQSDWLERARRVLAECEAKHRIVDTYMQASRGARDVVAWELESVLRLLAAPYSDHPGFREEWRP